MSQPVAIIFQHEAEEGPELLGDELSRAGFELRVRFREVRAGDESAPLVVILGGEMAAHGDSLPPFLSAELALVRHRLMQGLPCLGVCLGAQLLARAAGAQVAPGNAGPELPSSLVTVTDAARADPILHGMPARFFAPQWHGDTFGPVPQAELLASSALYPGQCFRIGGSYGFQFHLELDAARLSRWCTRLEADLVTARISREQAAQAVAKVGHDEEDLARLRRNVAEWLFRGSARGNRGAPCPR